MRWRWGGVAAVLGLSIPTACSPRSSCTDLRCERVDARTAQWSARFEAAASVTWFGLDGRRAWSVLEQEEVQRGERSFGPCSLPADARAPFSHLLCVQQNGAQPELSDLVQRWEGLDRSELIQALVRLCREYQRSGSSARWWPVDDES